MMKNTTGELRLYALISLTMRSAKRFTASFDDAKSITLYILSFSNRIIRQCIAVMFPQIQWIYLIGMQRIDQDTVRSVGLVVEFA